MEETNKFPLLENRNGPERELGLLCRTFEESKKQWKIVGPEMVVRLSLYGTLVITLMYAGHLGDVELASFSIVLNVIVFLDYGLLLGMSSALGTLCGQAYGANKYNMLGIYMQRSWIVLFLTAILILPIYLYASPILKLFGQPSDLADKTGYLCLWFIPMHFSFVIILPVQRFLQCQLKNSINCYGSATGFIFHVFICWLFIEKMKLGIVAVALTLNFSWWVLVFLIFGYVVYGGSRYNWHGFSHEAFVGLWEFTKLSMGAGVMICLEMWYYRLLMLLASKMKNAETAVDALSICMSINGLELSIPMAFFVGAGVRVANELGAGNGKAASFAAIISVGISTFIGLIIWALILGFSDKIGLMFTSSPEVLKAVDHLSFLLAFTVLLNSVQPVLSGVAVGSGWQGLVAYVNLGSYYLIGVPAGFILGWIFNLQVLGLWAGMIGGTAVQTLILTFLTVRCDWVKEETKAAARMNKWTTANTHSEDF